MSLRSALIHHHSQQKIDRRTKESRPLAGGSRTNNDPFAIHPPSIHSPFIHHPFIMHSPFIHNHDPLLFVPQLPISPPSSPQTLPPNPANKQTNIPHHLLDPHHPQTIRPPKPNISSQNFETSHHVSHQHAPKPNRRSPLTQIRPQSSQIGKKRPSASQ